jgi:hypothetical protein
MRLIEIANARMLAAMSMGRDAGPIFETASRIAGLEARPCMYATVNIFTARAIWRIQRVVFILVEDDACEERAEDKHPPEDGASRGEHRRQE